MQKARVVQKNIQFRDDIQIREIPRNESEPHMLSSLSDGQSSWDPNLTDTEAFNTPTTQSTQPKYVVIVIVVVGIVLVCAIIGTVIGVVLGQKTKTVADNSLAYNEVCTVDSNQCISSQGLSCSNGFCSCSSPYSWNTATTSCTYLTYNQSCTTSNQCDSSVGLICASTCTCNNSKVWNISTCVCPAGTFLNSSNLCQTAYTVNQSCTIGSNQCDSTKDLVCNNSRCQCDYSTKYWNINFQACKQRLNYSDMCVSDSDCLPTLICPTVPGVCNCSRYLPDLVCNCNNTKYYDPTTLQCVNRSSFGGSCLVSANYTCLITLYCNGGTCACPTGTSWIAANTACVTSG
ncbi:unnamed protein product [Rotaria sordida]|uniref:Uncharacterized protein n=1 Tax=Rotaria sordida TaxID=392033 RepID=A0A815BTW8_9BILA|nr:unnamed protein product [Rotaria sordida]